jgi:hypothetical protein
VNRYLELIKLRKLVKTVSLYGKSVVELYVADICRERVMNILFQKNITVLTNVEREETPFTTTAEQAERVKHCTIQRLSYLLAKTEWKNLRCCILSSLSSPMVDACLAAEIKVREELSKSDHVPDMDTC